MDFTALFVIVLAVLAAQNGLPLMGLALVAVAVFTAKNIFMVIAALIGAGLVGLSYVGVSDSSYIILGGLFAIFLIIAAKSPEQPNPYGGGGY
ncbi:hypothetical protein HY993_01140 [Candidatus Micrarchaeota archaeon]|nr:hypothetical protein [Candidatus Micrarchaeota archaeon]